MVELNKRVSTFASNLTEIKSFVNVKGQEVFSSCSSLFPEQTEIFSFVLGV